MSAVADLGGLNSGAIARWRRSPIGYGPAVVAAIAYVDPGNVATNVAAGARYGTQLLWVVVLATVAAGVVQFAAARIGDVGGRSLAEQLADRWSAPARLAYWVQAEVLSVATDVAEILGAAVALHLLFGAPLLPAAVIAGLVSAAILRARARYGESLMEHVGMASLCIIGAAFVGCLIFGHPPIGAIADGMTPRLGDHASIVLAAGIVGATIMPHAVHLHSSLAAARTPRCGHRRDVIRAMALAGSVNVAMLLLGAGARPSGPANDFGEIADGLSARLGPAAATAFLVALLVSGLTSTSVATQSGALLMTGLVRRRVPDEVRRAMTVVPALAMLMTGASALSLLVASQALLAVGLPITLVSLAWVARAPSSPRATLSRLVRVSLIAIVVAVTALDLWLLATPWMG